MANFPELPLSGELLDHHQQSSHLVANSSHDSLPFTLDGRNHRCSELQNQARRCTLGTYNFESHLAYRTPVIQQRLPPLLLLLGSSVRHVSRNHRHPKAFGKRVTTSRMNQSMCHLRMIPCTEVQRTTVGPTQSGSYYVKRASPVSGVV